MSEGPARRKRLPFRWLSLAEFVGIAALAVAALGYWDAHRERAAAERDKAAAAKEHQAEARAGALRRVFLMTGTPEGSGGRVRLSAVHPEQVIQTQALTFPTEVRGETVQTTGNPRLEAGWLEGGLEKALKAHGVTASRGRVPVGIVTTYFEDGQAKSDASVYLVGYSLHPRVLRSAKVELEGLSLVRRGVSEDIGRAVDAAWGRQVPAARPPA